MDWANFTVDLATKLVWLAIALASLALTFWQLWDLYGFKIRAYLAAEAKAHKEQDAWKQWANRLWNTPAVGYSYGG